MSTSEPLISRPIVYYAPRSSPGKRKARPGDGRLQPLLPMLEMTQNQAEATDKNRLFHRLWEVVRSRVGGDGLLVCHLDVDSMTVAPVSFGLCPRGQDVDALELVRAWVARTGQPLLFSQGPWLDTEISRLLKLQGLSSVMGMPLISQGKKLGVAVALRAVPQSPFTAEQMELLYLLCREVAIALRHIQLIEEVKELQGRVNWLAERSLVAREGERQRICLELHDGVAQWLVAANQCLQTVEPHQPGSSGTARKLVKIEDMLEQGLKELQWIMADLQSPPVAELGLSLALLQMVSRLSKLTNIHGHFQIVGSAQRLSTGQQMTIYRIVQEALNNVRKHSRAQEVTVGLHFTEEELRAMVEDNGQGFDVAQAVAGTGMGKRLGLAGMRERAETLGASFTIHSQPGRGTQVSLSLPLGQIGSLSPEGLLPG